LKVHRFLPALVLPALVAGVAAGASAAPRAYVSDVPRAVARDLGRVAADRQIDVAVALTYRAQDQLDQLVELQNDPGSPLYEHWLSSAQFNASFAPAPRDYARVIASLQHAGFRITQTYSNRTVVDAVASRGAVERYFNTEIHSVIQAGAGGERYANVRPAAAPLELAGLVRSVAGLNNLTLVHTQHHLAPTADRYAAVKRDAVIGLPLRGTDGGFGPLAFAQGYDMPVQHSTGQGSNTYDGTGRSSGVVIDADFLDSDLSGFLTFFKVARAGPATVRVKIDGGPPPGDGSPDSVETTLDVETIVGTAPGTALYVYEFPNFSKNSYITDAYNRVVSDNLVDTANSSFGGCETQQVSDAKTWDSIAQQGAALGITFHASSGDDGSRQPGCTGNTVSAPASGPHFEAIGGTVLRVDANGNWAGENAWSGSGGGVSTVFPLPKYQKKVQNVITTGRNVPDVAFDASPASGASFYYGGRFQGPIGGTSLSSPIFGGLTTELAQLQNKRLGKLDSKLYKIFKKNGYGTASSPLFRDITVGSNGGFPAQTGFDQVTGIGSVDGWNLGQQPL
jgi:kumamolisin